MSGNQNRNRLKKNKEIVEKKRLKKYRSDIGLIMQSAFPAVAYGALFILQSVIDESAKFSIVLAVFSLCVTVSFEANEWCIYLSKTKNKTYKMFDYFPPLLFMFVLLIIILLAYNGIKNFITIPESFLSISPNVITSLTLFFYFASYTYRSIMIRKYIYLSEKKH